MIMKNKSNISLATEIIKTEITALTRTMKRIDSRFDKACELIKHKRYTWNSGILCLRQKQF